MTFREALENIESRKFTVLLNTASSFRTFQYAACHQVATHAVFAQLNSPEHRREILERIRELSRRDIDTRYINPWDTALTVYVWLLSVKERELGIKDMPLAKEAAQIASQVQQGWWVHYICHYVLQKNSSGPIDELIPSSSTDTKNVKTGVPPAIVVPLSHFTGQSQVKVVTTKQKKEDVPAIWEDVPFALSKPRVHSKAA